MTVEPDIESRVADVMNAALEAIVGRREPATVVNSPPGAGKTWFCERLAALAIGEAQMRVCYVAPKVSQGEDMARRLVANNARFPVDVLVGGSRTVPADLVGRVTWTSDAAGIARAGRLVISNPQKLEHSRNQLRSGAFDLLVLDEAYQIAAKDLALVIDLAPVVALIGDPGQLAPTITIDTNAYEAHGSRVHWPAPDEVLRVRPSTPTFNIPASRRLVEDAVQIVQPNFYPNLPFVSAARNEGRRLAFRARGMNGPLDRALDMLEQGASIVGLIVPGEPPPSDERDPAVEQVVAAAAERLIARRAYWVAERDVAVRDVGVIDTHVLSGNATRAGLQARGLHDVRVDTPELWQGQQAPVIIAKHPLSVGSAAPGAFDLDAGRFCVMLSRHLLACLLVGRESIQDQLKSYMHDTRATPIGGRDTAWKGYRAHQGVWGALHNQQRLIRVEGRL